MRHVFLNDDTYSRLVGALVKLQTGIDLDRDAREGAALSCLLDIKIILGEIGGVWPMAIRRAERAMRRRHRHARR